MRMHSHEIVSRFKPNSKDEKIAENKLINLKPNNRRRDDLQHG
jgi:hypothetical protein